MAKKQHEFKASSYFDTADGKDLGHPFYYLSDSKRAVWVDYVSYYDHRDTEELVEALCVMSREGEVVVLSCGDDGYHITHAKRLRKPTAAERKIVADHEKALKEYEQKEAEYEKEVLALKQKYDR